MFVCMCVYVCVCVCVCVQACHSDRFFTIMWLVMTPQLDCWCLKGEWLILCEAYLCYHVCVVVSGALVT